MKKLFINLDKLRVLHERSERKNFKGVCKIILHELVQNAHRLRWKEFVTNSEWRHYSCKIRDYKILVATHGCPAFQDNNPAWIKSFAFEIVDKENHLASLEYKLLPAKYLETTIVSSDFSTPWPYLTGLLIADLFNRAELSVKNQR